MGSAAVLVDAGPLVAFLDRDDPGHQAAVACFTQLKGRAVTTWPVLTEAAHLLGKLGPAVPARLLELVARGVLETAPLTDADAARMAQMMGKYADLPMDLADASLVQVAEREGIATVVTFDRRDFRVYRVPGIGALKVLP